MQTWHLVERSVEHVLKQFKTHEDVATGRLLTLSDLQVLLQGGPKSKPLLNYYLDHPVHTTTH